MGLLIEIEREDDDRWISEIPDLPRVMVYGATVARVQPLALRALADRVEHWEPMQPAAAALFAVPA